MTMKKVIGIVTAGKGPPNRAIPQKEDETACQIYPVLKAKGRMCPWADLCERPDKNEYDRCGTKARKAGG